MTDQAAVDCAAKHVPDVRAPDGTHYCACGQTFGWASTWAAHLIDALVKEGHYVPKEATAQNVAPAEARVAELERDVMQTQGDWGHDPLALQAERARADRLADELYAALERGDAAVAFIIEIVESLAAVINVAQGDVDTESAEGVEAANAVLFDAVALSRRLAAFLETEGRDD